MKSCKRRVIIVCHLLLMVGLLVTSLPLHADAATATINLGQTNQTLRGFGGASAWLGQLSDANMDTLFGTGAGTIGLSILRIRIAPDGNWNDELQNAKKTVARGGIVMATPWTPPAAMKSNNNVVGGTLKASEFSNYANYLQGFANYMSSNGAALYAISIQNVAPAPSRLPRRGSARSHSRCRATRRSRSDGSCRARPCCASARRTRSRSAGRG